MGGKTNFSEHLIQSIQSMKSVIRLTFLTLFLIYFTPCFSCTIFYIVKDGIILAGNNEDWSDPDTKMWIIPSNDGKYGWIKFGFDNGYPQGGMNEYGIFWDGTACSYLPMPESEAGKTEYQGNLMRKVAEECTSLEEALEIFANYYCRDLYNAQYLTGDAHGYSIIAEGDNLIHSRDSFHILTNFYQSDPELGGYPCWRFETALEMISKSDKLDEYFAGTVLSATHQEGKYPTQYSNIYDPVNGLVYLFYFHNYEEYLIIDLKQELEKGYKQYDIPKIFSRITIVSPKTETGASTSSASPTISWKGVENGTYEIVYSPDPDLSQPVIVPVAVNSKQKINLAGTFILAPILVLLLFGFKKKKLVHATGLFLVFIVIVSSRCEKNNEDVDLTGTVEFSQTLEGLQPGTTYYWKIRASTDYSPDFKTETITYHFTTPD